MTSRSSFEETARYWSHIYAGAPAKAGKGTNSGLATRTGTPRDEVALAGLNKAHVDQFEALGFERTKVVSYLLYLLQTRFINLLRSMSYDG